MKADSCLVSLIHACPLNTKGKIYVFLYIAKKKILRQESLQKLQISSSFFVTTIATRRWNSAGLNLSAECGQLCSQYLHPAGSLPLWKKYSPMSEAVNFKSSQFHKQQTMKNGKLRCLWQLEQRFSNTCHAVCIKPQATDVLWHQILFLHI